MSTEAQNSDHIIAMAIESVQMAIRHDIVLQSYNHACTDVPTVS